MWHPQHPRPTRHPVTDTAERPAPTALPVGAADRRVRVLIADDNDLLRDLLGDLLDRTAGFEVAGFAADGIQALAAVQDLRPDVILLDLSMPHCDGLEVMQELRGRGERIPVVVHSGYGDVRTREIAHRHGATAVVQKGSDSAELLDALAVAAQAA